MDISFYYNNLNNNIFKQNETTKKLFHIGNFVLKIQEFSVSFYFLYKIRSELEGLGNKTEQEFVNSKQIYQRL